MERYVIGSEIEGLTKCELGSTEGEIKNSTAVVVLDERSNDKLYSFYSSVKTLIRNNNRVILCMVAEKSMIRKQISMLLASYGKYDIYQIEEVGELTLDYISNLESRSPSLEEVSTFVGSDITAFTEMSDIIIGIIDRIDREDVENLKLFIESNRDSIDSIPDVIDYMKRIVDGVNDGVSDRKIEDIKKKVELLQTEIEDYERKLKDAARNTELAKEGKSVLESDAIKAKQRITQLEEQLNSREPVIKTYSETQTQMIRCKAKIVIYFKEVQHISYISSMIVRMIEAMTKLHKLKVKLVIYDNKTSFLPIYKPIPIIGSSEYVTNKDTVVNKYDKVVVVETNQAIIEDILSADWDVVVVYDRLRQAKDIVSGNNVYKYWVMNSASEYTLLYQSVKVEKENIITRPGVFPESIAISDIPGYKTKTQSAKLADYVGMMNMGNRKSKLFELIFERTNVTTIGGRAKE